MVIRIGAFRHYEDRIDEIQAQAAFWVARENSGRIREAERIELREWLARSPAHELEYTLADSLYADETLTAALKTAPRLAAQRRALPVKAALEWVQQGLAAIAWPKLVAASLCLALCLASASVLFQPTPDAPAEDSRLARGMVLETRPGERLLVQLPDGSRVELGGDTSAEARFTPTERHFALRRGDAHFDVAHDTSRPFLIQTKRAGVRVVGTRFLISQLDEDTRVDVYDGTVEIRPDSDETSKLLLKRGSRVMIGRDVTITHFDATDENDWRNGWVDEAQISLGDLAKLVERRSGERIVIDNDLTQLKLSGRFRINRPDDLLEKLGHAYGFKKIYKDNTYYLVDGN
ncbi:FecR family protein [Novosphingobium mathurense]|uniref:FecR family protein n=1 Tax=Novosphingobium mathurense TaxID=428990 RepID=A0A1U6IWN6_9SPHN|nr:FecR domain-containing protein [Novosphingobium mathurense]SLK12392.1 FecR family protein [Novosphingobium mathurense]